MNGFVDNKILLGKVDEQIQALPEERDSPGEYWADSFANYIIDNIDLLKDAGEQMSGFLKNALDPYINPRPKRTNNNEHWIET